ncbi:MBL fold metallo-hydrolase [Georgenia thermotolerans]|uniref:MBL fold metallo-hydrolase n=1 Tax=Georgenia thermotolerans TaxID=527326 RepID=A0A7J5UT45_9MICO|nr:MBL fold metallo-hydrolase [Georgenia thermotolerans]KAE8765073.1 MBL fold metallo-hydrolase [Georgenia thermotolerans]
MTALAAVADGVLVATHEFCTTTTTVVLGEDGGCLVVDPAVTPAEIDALAAELAALGRRVTASFSTHPHWDHLLWRDALGEAPRWATAAGARAARERQAENRQKALAALPGLDVSGLGRVTAVPEGAATLPWAGPRVEVLEHRAHAPGHAALLVPDAGVLVAGDMLSDIEIPLPDTAAADPLGDYDRALDLFAAALSRVDVVVPGHGSAGDRAALRRRIAADRRYLADVRAGRPVEDPRLSGGPDWLQREHAELLSIVGRVRDR